MDGDKQTDTPPPKIPNETHIRALGLSPRVYNALKAENHNTVGHIRRLSYKQFKRLFNLGKMGLYEIVSIIGNWDYPEIVVSQTTRERFEKQRRLNRERDNRYLHVYQLRRNGKMFTEIGQILGVSNTRAAALYAVAEERIAAGDLSERDPPSQS